MRDNKDDSQKKDDTTQNFLGLFARTRSEEQKNKDEKAEHLQKTESRVYKHWPTLGY